MGRWGPNARGRLAQAALDLYLERGFEQTTTAEIARRARLTERTFFRHFADKREVLFGGQGALRDFIVDAVAGAPDSATTPLRRSAKGVRLVVDPKLADEGDRVAVGIANCRSAERLCSPSRLPLGPGHVGRSRRRGAPGRRRRSSTGLNPPDPHPGCAGPSQSRSTATRRGDQPSAGCRRGGQRGVHARRWRRQSRPRGRRLERVRSPRDGPHCVVDRLVDRAFLPLLCPWSRASARDVTGARRPGPEGYERRVALKHRRGCRGERGGARA